MREKDGPTSDAPASAADYYAGSPPAPIAVTVECSGTDVLALCLVIGVRHVAHVDQQVSRSDFFQRCPEGRDQLGRQVGHEADRVRQDHLVEARQAHVAHGRIERREHLRVGDRQHQLPLDDALDVHLVGDQLRVGQHLPAELHLADA